MGLISRVSSRTYRKIIHSKMSSNPVSSRVVEDFNKNVIDWVEKFDKYWKQVKKVNGYKSMPLDKKLMSTIRKEDHICDVLKHGRNLLKRGIDQTEKKC